MLIFFNFQEARNIIRAYPDDDIRLVCIGDKSRAGLQRLFSKHFLVTGNDIGRTPPTFADASIAAKAVLDTGFEFDEVKFSLKKFYFL